MAKSDISTIDRFYSKVFPITESGCWFYDGGKTKDGYGMFFGEHHGVKKDMLAHRYSYLIHKGEIDGFVVMHKCDNPFCVNPAHLELGTQAENLIDCIKKNRHAKTKNRPNIPDGYKKRTVANNGLKVSTEDVAKMIAMRKNGMRNIEISEIFNVSKETVSRLINGCRKADRFNGLFL